MKSSRSSSLKGLVRTDGKLLREFAIAYFSIYMYEINEVIIVTQIFFFK